MRDNLVLSFAGPGCDPARGRLLRRRAGLRELHDARPADLGRKVDLSVVERGGRFDGDPRVAVR